MNSASLPLSDQMLELVARRFRMLGEPQRLRILQLLEQGERTVTEIVTALDANQSNISKHLQVLNESGLVSRRREGNSIYYAIADPLLFEICALVCKGVAQDAHSRLSGLTATLLQAPKESR